MSATPDRFPRPVVCAWCGNRHRSIVPFETSTQGDACAASVFQITEANMQSIADMLSRDSDEADLPTLAVGEWLVKGHYGSTSYDCHLFRYVQNSPTAAADPICDNCIGERSTAGDLKQIKGNFP